MKLTCEPDRVGHNSLLLHGQAVRLFRSEFQKVHGGRIGIALVWTFQVYVWPHLVPG